MSASGDRSVRYLNARGSAQNDRTLVKSRCVQVTTHHGASGISTLSQSLAAEISDD